MYTEPIILPLDRDETVFALQDQNGRIIGAGSREVCELLAHIINEQASTREAREAIPKVPHRNIRAAIVI
jgi:hypothetical protein